MLYRLGAGGWGLGAGAASHRGQHSSWTSGPRRISWDKGGRAKWVVEAAWELRGEGQHVRRPGGSGDYKANVLAEIFRRLIYHTVV